MRLLKSAVCWQATRNKSGDHPAGTEVIIPRASRVPVRVLATIFGCVSETAEGCISQWPGSDGVVHAPRRPWMSSQRQTGLEDPQPDKTTWASYARPTSCWGGPRPTTNAAAPETKDRITPWPGELGAPKDQSWCNDRLEKSSTSLCSLNGAPEAIGPANPLHKGPQERSSRLADGPGPCPQRSECSLEEVEMTALRCLFLASAAVYSSSSA